MKIRAITPEEAKSNKDPLMDVEIECLVARINCILARNYTTDAVEIPYAAFGENTYIRTNTLLRFQEHGWNVRLMVAPTGHKFFTFAP